MQTEQLRATVLPNREGLYRVNWNAVPMVRSAVAPDKVIVVGGAGRLAALLGVAQVAAWRRCALGWMPRRLRSV